MEKIIAFIKTNKIIVFLALILLLLVVLRLIIKKEEILPGEKKQPSPLEKEEKILPPERSPSPEKKPLFFEKENYLNFISAYPEAGKHETISNRYKIFFTFDKNLNSKVLEYSISPKIEFAASFEENKLMLYPQQKYLYDANYVLEITSLESTGGAKLKDSVKYPFSLTFPEKVITDHRY